MNREDCYKKNDTNYAAVNRLTAQAFPELLMGADYCTARSVFNVDSKLNANIVKVSVVGLLSALALIFA